MVIRPQYHFRPSPNGFYAWDVRKLAELSAPLVPIAKLLSEIAELDEAYWCYVGDSEPTVKSLAAHMKQIELADLSYPIILCAKGRVMDGMHRIAKAWMQGDTAVQAVQFTATPAPDFTDVGHLDVPY